MAPPAWSSTAKNDHVTVSVDGLSVTSDLAGDVSGRSSDSMAINPGDKRIWKLTPVISQGASGTCVTGVCNSTVTFNDGEFFGAQAGGCGWANNGTVILGNTIVSFAFPNYSQGDALYMAVEGGNKIWGGVNAAPDVLSAGADISALGVVYPAYGLGGFAHAGDQSTAQFTGDLGIILPDGFSVFPSGVIIMSDPANPQVPVTASADVSATNPLPCIQQAAGTPATDVTVNPATWFFNGDLISATNPLPITLS